MKQISKLDFSTMPNYTEVVSMAQSVALRGKMSSVGNANEARDSASSHVPQGSDCCRGGSGLPINHGNYSGQVVRTPLRGISPSSNATQAASKAKGKVSSEVQGSMSSGNGGFGPINNEENPR